MYTVYLSMLRTTCTIVHSVLRIIAHPPCAACAHTRSARPPACLTPARTPPPAHPHAPARPAACRTAQRGRFWHTHPALPRERSFSYSPPLPGHFRPCHTNPPFCVYRSIRRMFRGCADDAAQDADCAAQDADSSAFPVVVRREWRRRCGCGWGGSGGESVGTAGRIGRAPVPRSARPRGIGFGWRPAAPPLHPLLLRVDDTPEGGEYPPAPYPARERWTPYPPPAENGGGRRKKIRPENRVGRCKRLHFRRGWGGSVYDGKARGKGLCEQEAGGGGEKNFCTEAK